ncbi:hypothetical protein RSOLAG22IIIB_01081 [Rhizoctonia solani]|uniref:MIT domain-containing protein n=1 Tax=Rhizoctonia solani TaxID=456999 RepID=A0A0K6G230_9AGAM|nr:hypothetical protein RSOLAG22IIIB_01081 [Rhizoctonia solani]
MSFKTLLYSVYTVLVALICGTICRLSKYKEIFSRCTLRSRSRHSSEGNSERRGRYHNKPETTIGRRSEGDMGGKIHEGEREPTEPGTRKSRDTERPSCRRKLEAALPILLQAVELDNAGSLEAVGAYKAVAKLFDDAIEILNNRPSKSKRLSTEANLRSLRDTYRDRADLLLLDFQERVLKQKF